MARKKKYSLFTASSKGQLFRSKCEGCGETIVVGAIDKFCPFCFEEISLGAPVKTASLRASLESPRLKCGTCSSKIYSNSSLKDEDLSNRVYCTVCGSSEVEVISEEENSEEEVNIERAEDGEVNTEEVNTEVEKIEPEIVEEDREEEEVQDALSSDSLGIEASLISSPEPTWVFFKGGVPAFKLVKSKTPVAAHPIFDTDQFLEAFKQRAKETSLTSTVKEFNGDVFELGEVLSSLDLEELAFERLQSTVIPKFLDCLALSIEGAVKGVYPSLNKQLKAAFFDELVARGLTDSKAISAVESAFTAAGSDVFTALVSKATELMYKKPETYKEIKSTIQSSGTIHGELQISEEDLEQKEVEEKLRAGNINFNPSKNVLPLSVINPIADKTIASYRERISFRK
jgi:Zn finger protein HypA/HybF involved in hydrogenase expression